MRERVNAHDESVFALCFDDAGGGLEHPDRGGGGFFEGAWGDEETGRPMATEVADVEGTVRFVLRDKDADMRGEVGGGFFNEAVPRFFGIGVEEARVRFVIFIVEPIGESEVPEGNDGFDTGGAEFFSHGGVLVKGA